MNPRYYRVVAHIQRETPSGGVFLSQLPAFHLSSDIHGLTSEDSAHRLASILLRDLLPEAALYITVTAEED